MQDSEADRQAQEETKIYHGKTPKKGRFDPCFGS
jgi:hypothetical protein